MTILSPSTMRSSATEGRPVWYRLSRTDDGLLCLEEISDATLNRSGPPADWAFCADVPPRIAKQLIDDNNPAIVAKVLDRAIHALAYA